MFSQVVKDLTNAMCCNAGVPNVPFLPSLLFEHWTWGQMFCLLLEIARVIFRPGSWHSSKQLMPREELPHLQPRAIRGCISRCHPHSWQGSLWSHVFSSNLLRTDQDAQRNLSCIPVTSSGCTQGDQTETKRDSTALPMRTPNGNKSRVLKRSWKVKQNSLQTPKDTESRARGNHGSLS